MSSSLAYEYLQEKLDTARGGGRVERVAGSKNKFVVLDCPKWEEKDTRALIRRFPDAVVWMEAEGSSLSGFAIHIRVPSRRRQAWAACLGVVMAVASYTLWILWNQQAA